MLIVSCGMHWTSQGMPPGMMFPGDRTKIADEDYAMVKGLHEHLNSSYLDSLSEEKKVNAIVGVLNPEDGGGNLLHAIANNKFNQQFVQAVLKFFLIDCLKILVDFNDPFAVPGPFSALACSAITQRDASGKTPLDYASTPILEIFFDYLDNFSKDSFINLEFGADGKTLWDRAWSNMSHYGLSFDNIILNNNAMLDVYDEKFELILVLLKNLSDNLRNNELIMGSRYEYISYDDPFQGKEFTKGLPTFYPLPYLMRYYKLNKHHSAHEFDVLSAKLHALQKILASMSGAEAREKAIIQKIRSYNGNSFQMAVEHNQPSDIIQILINNISNEHLNVLLKGLPDQKTRDKVITAPGMMSMQFALSQVASDDKLERLKLLLDLISPAAREKACKDLALHAYNNLIQKISSEKQFKALKLILSYKIFSDDELSQQLMLLTEDSSDLFSSIDHAKVIIEALGSKKSKTNAITRLYKDGASLLHCAARKTLNKQDEDYLKLLIESVDDKDLLAKALRHKDDKGESVFDIYPGLKDMFEEKTGLPAKLAELKKQLESLKQKLEALKKGLADLTGALQKAPAVT